MASAMDYVTIGTTLINMFFGSWIVRRQGRANHLAAERAEAESYAKTESQIRGWIGTMRDTRPDSTVKEVLDECVRRLTDEREPPMKRGAAENAVANVQLALALPVGNDAATMAIGAFKPVAPPVLEPAPGQKVTKRK